MVVLAGKPLTDRSHFFACDKYVGFLNVRDVACLNCAACSQGDFFVDRASRCENKHMCGEVSRAPVQLASGAREDTPKTRYSVSNEGLKLAKAVKIDEIVGAECANETEPYILFKALSESYEVTAEAYNNMQLEYKHNWMGEVCVGDLVIKGLKLDRRAGGLYSETTKVFYLFAEDTRGVVRAAALQRKQSQRAKGNKAKPEMLIYDVDDKSLEIVKKSVFLPEPLNFVPKRA